MEMRQFDMTKKHELNIGDNKIIIKVEAEDGKTIKEYILK